MTGVSVVIPVHNGAPWIRGVIDAVRAHAAGGRALEILVVDDHSTDASAAILAACAHEAPLRVLRGAGRGAAAAINLGIAAARYPIVCQIDQDVLVNPGWMTTLVAALGDVEAPRHPDRPVVAAAQGCYVSDPRDPALARVMGLDLEQRYGAIGLDTDHVCTGNAAYRVDALRAVGLFDERLGYGYDNDMSYRLRDAGYRLRFCREATSRHRWRHTIRGYCAQQYGFGYGRLELVAKHPRRVSGDAVSPALMMAHPLVMGAAIGLLVLAAALGVMSRAWIPAASIAAVLVGGLALERAIAGVRAWRRFEDRAALLFPILHLCRDVVWTAAIGVWATRRLLRRDAHPSHSMRKRPARTAPSIRPPVRRVLGVIPAHNEAASLAAVVGDMRACCPWLDVLVVDDGLSDETPMVLELLGVPWIRLPERMGVGSAMRAGLRYAARLRYDTVVRLDGDGQHQALDIDAMLAPLRDGRADVVLGSRFTDGDRSASPHVRVIQRALGRCLSLLTGRSVTDPTSGFCAFGPRAVRLLAEHHPTGYPEAELRLLINRNGLEDVEVPVRARPRLGGRSSLTAGRLAAAACRVLLAMIIVPLRQAIGGDRD